MIRSGRLLVALHALVHVHLRADAPQTSEALASCLSSNPVVVRRTLGRLREAGIVSSARGPGGGWTLARPAEAITLRDVCAALGEELVELAGVEGGHPGCPIVRTVSATMDGLETELRELVAARTARVTIADLAAATSGHPPFHPPQEHTHAR